MRSQAHLPVHTAPKLWVSMACFCMDKKTVNPNCSHWSDINSMAILEKPRIGNWRVWKRSISLNEGREVYLSHSNPVGAALAETAHLQVTEDEAERYILLQEMPFV